MMMIGTARTLSLTRHRFLDLSSLRDVTSGNVVVKKGTDAIVVHPENGKLYSGLTSGDEDPEV